MDNSLSAIPLLSKWEEYKSSYPKGNLPDFAHWLTTHGTPLPMTVKMVKYRGTPRVRSISGAVKLDEVAESTLLIARLHSVLRILAKPAIKELGFTKDREFRMLVQVALMDRPNKKELCEALLLESSTGVEITKRLAKKGYLLEETDEKDKRSARLSLTEKGMNTLQEGYQKLGLIHSNFLDCLSAPQKKELVTLLTTLNNYHTDKLKTMTGDLSPD